MGNSMVLAIGMLVVLVILFVFVYVPAVVGAAVWFIISLLRFLRSKDLDINARKKRKNQLIASSACLAALVIATAAVFVHYLLE